MRVAHVITRLIVGGAQENTTSTVLGLHEKPGVNVRLYCGPTTGPEGSLEPLVQKVDGLFHRVPNLIRPVRPLSDWLAYRQLKRAFASFRPDIVHTHSGKAGFIGRLAAKRAGVPKIIHSIHGPSFGLFQGWATNALFRGAERFAGRMTDHFVTVADAMRDQYLSAGISQADDYTRIPSGFDLQPFLDAENSPTKRASLGLSPGDFVVGKIARLFELKGHDDLFAIAPRLARRIPNIRFLLVGDGVWRGRFERLAKEIGCGQNFIFTGLVPPSEIPSLVGVMDALVHLSKACRAPCPRPWPPPSRSWPTIATARAKSVSTAKPATSSSRATWPSWRNAWPSWPTMPHCEPRLAKRAGNSSRKNSPSSNSSSGSTSFINGCWPET